LLVSHDREVLRQFECVRQLGEISQPPDMVLSQ